MKKVGVFLAVSLLFTQTVLAHVLVYKITDPHSKQSNLPNLVKLISLRSKEFKKVYPDLKVVISITGDLVGINLETYHDGGWFNFKTLETLSSLYDVVFTLGNHDSFDFVGTEHEYGKNLQNNELFVEQFDSFFKKIQAKNYPGSPWGILAANVDGTEHSSHLFREYQDISLPSDKTLRVVGLVLEDLVKMSSYDPDSSFQVLKAKGIRAHSENDIDGIVGEKDFTLRPIIDTGIEQYIQAEKDGVDFIAFEIHDNSENVSSFARNLLLWRNEHVHKNHKKKIKILFIGAAHDHKRKEYYIEHESDRVPFINSMDNFATTEMLFDNAGDLVDINLGNTEAQTTGPLELSSVVHFWSIEAQKSYVLKNAAAIEQVLSPQEKKLIIGANHILASVSPVASEVLGPVPFIPETKMDLKDGRRRLGNLLADSLYRWGVEYINTHPKMKPGKGVIAFQNSTSYRSTEKIQEGAMTRGHIIEMFPFNSKVGFFYLSGEEIQKLYTTINSYKRRKKQIYSPQMPSHIEVDKRGQLLIRDEKGLAPLRSNEYYWLVTDDFLASNKMRHRVLKQIFDRARAEKRSLEDTAYTQDLHVKYLPRLLQNYYNCGSLLENLDVPANGSI